MIFKYTNEECLSIYTRVGKAIFIRPKKINFNNREETGAINILNDMRDMLEKGERIYIDFRSIDRHDELHDRFNYKGRWYAKHWFTVASVADLQDISCVKDFK